MYEHIQFPPKGIGNSLSLTATGEYVAGII